MVYLEPITKCLPWASIWTILRENRGLWTVYRHRTSCSSLSCPWWVHVSTQFPLLLHVAYPGSCTVMSAVVKTSKGGQRYFAVAVYYCTGTRKKYILHFFFCTLWDNFRFFIHDYFFFLVKLRKLLIPGYVPCSKGDYSIAWGTFTKAKQV